MNNVILKLVILALLARFGRTLSTPNSTFTSTKSSTPTSTSTSTSTSTPTSTKSSTPTTTLDSCQSSPCKNGGICYNAPMFELSYACNCPPGYIGASCEYIDPCSPSPCLNGGICVAVILSNNTATFMCYCPGLYYGPTCNKKFVPADCYNKYPDECNFDKSVPIFISCDMEKFIFSMPVREACTLACVPECTPTTTSTTTVSRNDCISNPCQNGGTCISRYPQPGYDCLCTVEGVNCEFGTTISSTSTTTTRAVLSSKVTTTTPVDPCSAKPCPVQQTCETIYNSASNSFSYKCQPLDTSSNNKGSLAHYLNFFFSVLNFNFFH